MRLFDVFESDKLGVQTRSQWHVASLLWTRKKPLQTKKLTDGSIGIKINWGF